jgi:hypothetical protein
MTTKNVLERRHLFRRRVDHVSDVGAITAAVVGSVGRHLTNARHDADGVEQSVPSASRKATSHPTVEVIKTFFLRRRRYGEFLQPSLIFDNKAEASNLRASLWTYHQILD